MLNVVLACCRLICCDSPITFHHLISDSSILCSVAFANPLTDIIKNFFISFNPVHFSVRSCYKTVKRYVHKGNYFSHIVLFFIVVYGLLLSFNNYRQRNGCMFLLPISKRFSVNLHKSLLEAETLKSAPSRQKNIPPVTTWCSLICLCKPMSILSFHVIVECFFV